jgi:antitoxin component YwqK of YwqJK toxin-antitoxin module
MREVILSLLLIFVLSGCKQSAIKKNFSTADSLVIYFKNEQAGEITKTVQTADAKAIGRMIEFIDGKGSELFKCGYDGKMFFYSKGNQMQEVDFKNKDKTCNHFSFLLNGKLVSTKMNNEAVDFLNALEKGMPYY